MGYNVRMSTLPRKLDKPKIQGKSCPEIADFIDKEAKRLGRRGLKWKNRAGVGPLLNFLVAWYSLQPKDERERIAGEGREKLADILSHEYIEPDDAPDVKPKASGKVNPRPGSAKKLPNHRNAGEPVGDNAAVVLQ
jgi:hypothetical protein